MAGNLNCPQCGAHLESGSTECKYCGEVIQQIKPIVDNNVNATQSQQEIPNNRNNFNNGNNMNNRNNYSGRPINRQNIKKSPSGCMVVVIIFLVLGSLSCIIPSIFGLFTSSSLKNSIGNDANVNVTTNGTNVVANGGAEEDLGGWERIADANTDYEKFDLTVDNTNAFKGTKCFNMKKDGLDGNIKQTIKLQKGESYLLSLFVKGTSEYSTENKVNVNFKFVTDSGEEESKYDIEFTNIWKLQKEIVKVPSSITSDQVQFKLGLSSNGDKTVYLDDIKVEQVISKKKK